MVACPLHSRTRSESRFGPPSLAAPADGLAVDPVGSHRAASGGQVAARKAGGQTAPVESRLSHCAQPQIQCPGRLTTPPMTAERSAARRQQPHETDRSAAGGRAGSIADEPDDKNAPGLLIHPQAGAGVPMNRTLTGRPSTLSHFAAGRPVLPATEVIASVGSGGGLLRPCRGEAGEHQQGEDEEGRPAVARAQPPLAGAGQ